MNKYIKEFLLFIAVCGTIFCVMFSIHGLVSFNNYVRNIEKSREIIQEKSERELNNFFNSYFEKDEMATNIIVGNSSYLDRELNDMRKNYFVTSVSIRYRGTEVFSWGEGPETFKSTESYRVSEEGHLLAGKSFFIKDSNRNIIPDLECTLWLDISRQMGLIKLDLKFVPTSSVNPKVDRLFLDNVYITIDYLDFLVHVAKTSPMTIVIISFFSISLYVVLIELLQKYRLKVSWTERLVSLISILEEKDAYTYGHGNRVAEYSEAIAKKIGLSKKDIKKITLAAGCHDLGKIFVSSEILNKKGKLTDFEMGEIQKHSQDSERVFMHLMKDKEVGSIIRHHHERWDGEGYPDKLKESDIPLGSRIIALADTFDAMTSNRPYREAMKPEKALSIIESNMNSQFDPYITPTAIAVMSHVYEPEKASLIDYTYPDIENI